VPEADFPKLLDWSDQHLALVYGEVPPSEQIRHAEVTIALHQYIFDMAERRRLAPGDDLISDLYRSVEAGQALLSAEEVACLLFVVLLAGFETTIKLLGNCLRALLVERRHWQAVVDDPARIPTVVEEALRFDGPALCTFRTAREDVDLDGTPIPAGSRVQVLMASANRDEATFPDGESFDPSREHPAGHLAFGFGVHFCIGAPLARLETRVALEQLARRLPSLRLVPDQQFKHKANLILRGPQRLLVEWDATT
jgi:cytochrome P450